MQTITKQSGFTLLEIIIVIVITGIIASLGSRMLIEGSRSYYNARDLLVAYWQGQITVQRLSRDLANIRSLNDISTATSTNLVFTNMDGTSLNYLVSGSNITINGNVLTNSIDISGSSFSYYDSNSTATTTLSAIRFIKVQLKFIKNNISYTLVNTIYPRNLA